MVHVSLMMKTLISAILFILIFNLPELTGQTACEKFLAQTVDLRQLIEAESRQEHDSISISIQNNFFRYSDCGLDSIDIQILQRHDVFIITISALMTDSIVSYGDILDEFHAFMQMPEYAKMKKLITEIALRKKVIVTEENWKAFFTMMLSEFENPAVAALNEFALAHISDHLTYSELFDQYQNAYDKGEIKINEENNPLKDIMNRSALQEYISYCDTTYVREFCCGIHAFTDYEKGIECATSLGKPVLLYFNAWADVNSRYMDENMLNDDAINAYIAEHFVMINLKVDDRTALADSAQYISTINGNKILTTGNKNMDFQLSRFNSNSQPFFYIIGREEKIIAGKTFTRQAADFHQWLVSGFAQFDN